MIRISGVVVPEYKHVGIAPDGDLRHRPFPWRKRYAQDIGVDAGKRMREIDESEMERLRNAISGLVTEGDLRREFSVNIKRLVDMGCYRGLRHRYGLPVRGQRTKTNARTRKGPRRIRGEEVRAARWRVGSAKRKSKRVVTDAIVHIAASFNNTVVTFSDHQGEVIAWATTGSSGFKGARKGTPYAAQITAENAARRAQENRRQEYRSAGCAVWVRGGISAIRALNALGFRVTSIRDVTPLPHNGLPPAQAAAGVGGAKGAVEPWRDTPVRNASCPVAKGWT